MKKIFSLICLMLVGMSSVWAEDGFTLDDTKWYAFKKHGTDNYYLTLTESSVSETNAVTGAKITTTPTYFVVAGNSTDGFTLTSSNNSSYMLGLSSYAWWNVSNNVSTAWTISGNDTDGYTIGATISGHDYHTIGGSNGSYVYSNEDNTTWDLVTMDIPTSFEYTVVVNGPSTATITIDGTAYSNGGTVTASNAVTTTDITASDESGYYLGSIVVDASTITVNYVKVIDTTHYYKLKSAAGTYAAFTTVSNTELSYQSDGATFALTYDDATHTYTFSSTDGKHIGHTQAWDVTSADNSSYYIEPTDAGDDSYYIRRNDQNTYLSGNSGATTAGTAIYTDKTSPVKWFLEDAGEIPAQCSVTYNYYYNSTLLGSYTTSVNQGADMPACGDLPVFASAETPSNDTNCDAIIMDVNVTINMPFEPATTFDGITKWYALNIHSNNHSWFSVGSDGELTGTAWNSALPTGTDRNNYLFGFVGDYLSGFQIYAYANGKAVADTDPCTFGTAATWKLYAPATAVTNGFCLSTDGGSNYINAQNGGLSLSRWSDADAGSVIVVTEAVPEYEIYLLGGPEGKWTPSTPFETLTTSDGKATYHFGSDNIVYLAASTTLGTSDDDWDGYKTGRFGDYIGSGNMEVSNGTVVNIVVGNDQSFQFAPGSWTIEFDLNAMTATVSGTALTTYYIKNNWLNGLGNFNSSSEWTWIPMTSDDHGESYHAYGVIGVAGVNFNTSESDTGADWYTELGGTTLKAGVGYDFVYDATTGSFRVTEKYFPVNVNDINSASYGTFYDDVAYYIPNDVTVYTLTENGTSLKATEITDGIIPANTGVVVKATEGAGTVKLLPVMYSETGSADAGVLSGVTIDTEASTVITTGQTCYVLSATVNSESGAYENLGFYEFSGTTLGANKAYYAADSSTRGFVIEWGDGTETAISTLNLEPSTLNSSIYDLQGRQMKQLQKGINIVNGKKILK